MNSDLPLALQAVDADQVELLGTTVEKLTADLDGHALTTALDDFGWAEVLRTAPQVAIPTLFAAMGRNGRWCAALHDVLASSIELPGATLALPLPGATAAGSRRGDDVVVDGLLLGARPGSSTVLVPLHDDGETDLVELPIGHLDRIERLGLAPGLLATGLVGTAVPTTTVHAARPSWTRAEAMGRLALAHYLGGAMRTMFELARDHATDRVQFGRPVGTFQAVRHKLAEAFVAVESLDAAANWAWQAEDLPLAAATAKVVASRSANVVAAHAQQVLAGVGFTAEHPFHPHLKRVVVLDRVLGGGQRLAADVGRRLAERGTARRLVDL